MADPKPTPPFQIQLPFVDKNGRLTRDAATVLSLLWKQVQEQQKQIEELKQPLNP